MCVCVCVCVYVCMCVCVYVCMCMCAFISFHLIDFSWLNKTINVKPEVRSAMVCWENYTVSSRYVKDNHSGNVQAENCAKECQLKRTKPRWVKDNTAFKKEFSSDGNLWKRQKRSFFSSAFVCFRFTKISYFLNFPSNKNVRKQHLSANAYFCINMKFSYMIGGRKDVLM